MPRPHRLASLYVPAGLALLAGAGFALVPAAGAVGPPTAQAPAVPAITPAPRPGNWERQHEAFLKRAAEGPVDLLFLGDSITAGWNGTGGDVWKRHYAPRHAANFGIGGDRTQHVLWRIEHGELDAVKPKVVVLMIGTNNMGDPAEQIAQGVEAVVGQIRAKLPDAKVLLLAVFPRGSNKDKTIPTIAPEAKIGEVNARVAKLDDGKMVKYLDIGPKFLNEEGQVNREVMPDFLHLSKKGYRIWADAIEPTLWDLMGGS